MATQSDEEPKGAIARMGDAATADTVLDFWESVGHSGPALISGGLRLSYSDLADRVRGVAERLRNLGLRPGDRLAIVGENDPGVLAAMFAAWRAGATAIPLNARYTPRELGTILDHAEPRLTLFVGEAGGHGAAHGLAYQLDEELGVRSSTANERSTADTIADDPRERPAQILYTSGTTGAPKGVVLPHRAVVTMMDLWARTRTVTPDDLVYQVLPLSHSYGLNSLALGALNRGCPIELVSRFDPAHLHAAFGRGVALFQGVPAMYAKYLSYLDATGATHVSPRLKALGCGGAPLDPALKARAEVVFGIPLRQAYGLTEAGPGVTMPLPGGAARSLGVALPGTSVRVIDPETGADVPDGKPGELLVKGPGVMLGYYRDPVATAAALTSDGWLRTGDIVERTPVGELLIAGRARDIIIRSGFNVHPAEVEAVLTTHPAVSQAAVVGRPADDADEEVVAFVELRAGATAGPEELAIHATANLAGYKRPMEIRVLPALPLGPTGKVATAALRALARSDRP